MKIRKNIIQNMIKSFLFPTKLWLEVWFYCNVRLRAPNDTSVNMQQTQTDAGDGWVGLSASQRPEESLLNCTLVRKRMRSFCKCFWPDQFRSIYRTANKGGVLLLSDGGPDVAPYTDAPVETRGFELAMKSRKLYASRHGYSHLRTDCNTECAPLPQCPLWRRKYWQKWCAMKEVMERFKSSTFEWFVWMDSDVFIVDMERPLANVLAEGNSSMVAQMQFFPKLGRFVINAGLFMFRNCEWSQRFLRLWLSSWRPWLKDCYDGTSFDVDLLTALELDVMHAPLPLLSQGFRKRRWWPWDSD